VFFENWRIDALVKTADQRTTMRLSAGWGLREVFSGCLALFWSERNAGETPVKQHFKQKKKRKAGKKEKLSGKQKFEQQLPRSFLNGGVFVASVCRICRVTAICISV